MNQAFKELLIRLIEEVDLEDKVESEIWAFKHALRKSSGLRLIK